MQAYLGLSYHINHLYVNVTCTVTSTGRLTMGRAPSGQEVRVRCEMGPEFLLPNSSASSISSDLVRLGPGSLERRERNGIGFLSSTSSTSSLYLLTSATRAVAPL